MRGRLLCGALALNLFIPPAGAQGVTEGEAHIFSAFTTAADPRVLAEDVTLGPVLRGELGAQTDSRTIYEALIERTFGRRLSVNRLEPGEVVRYASLPGVTAGEQLIRLDAGDLALLLQYAPKQKNVTFIEQLSAPPLRAVPPKPVVEVAPPPPPVVPVLVVPPVVVETLKPAAPVVQKPKPTPPAVAVSRTPPKPESRARGDCVIKPVMSEQDLWNCSAPARPAPMGTLTAPAAVQTPPPAASAPAALQQPPECVIKPVMSEEDLRICAAAASDKSGGRRVVTGTPAEPLAAGRMATPTPQPAALEPSKVTPECVIKPVMSEEDLRICAAASRQQRAATPTAVEPVAARGVATQAPAAPEPPKATPECVIKPVMSDQDMRNCAAAASVKGGQTRAVSEAAPQPVAAEKPQPAAPQLPRECVIKPVMSEEDLRACGVVRR